MRDLRPRTRHRELHVTMMLCPACWGAKRVLAKRCAHCAGAGAVPDAQLSPHFALSELLASQTAVRRKIGNAPTDQHKSNLRQLCAECLEPMRAQFGPLHVSSGLRVKLLNRTIGSSDSSAHTQGWAADIVPVKKGVALKSIVDWVVASSLAYDQIIYEGTWVHIGRFAADGKRARKQALMMFGGKYTKYAPLDPRVL